MAKFRKHHPTNTCSKVYRNYRSYKDPWLINDFFNRCGYCNDHDTWAGGKRGMQIDHFAPKKKFPEQENVYDNLVYACFYCNNHKSDDWVTDAYNKPVSVDKKKGYIHPRNEEFAVVFNRDEYGKINPLTDIADYMFKQLCLGLKRHELIYMLEELHDLWKALEEVTVDESLDQEEAELILEHQRKLSHEFMKFFEQYRNTLNN